MGWNTAANGSGVIVSPGATYTPTGHLTLYAQWGPVCNPTLTRSGGDAIWKFSSPGFCAWDVPENFSSVDILVVGIGFATG